MATQQEKTLTLTDGEAKWLKEYFKKHTHEMATRSYGEKDYDDFLKVVEKVKAL